MTTPKIVAYLSLLCWSYALRSDQFYHWVDMISIRFIWIGLPTVIYIEQHFINEIIKQYGLIYAKLRLRLDSLLELV